MSSPRRHTSNSPLVWTPGQQSVVMVLVCMLVAWAGGQGALWLWDFCMRGDHFQQPTELWKLFRLDTDFADSHYYWKIVAYGLVHDNALHCFLNIAVLYFAGREVEPILGRRHLLALCLTAWIVGGVFSWAAHIRGIPGGNIEVGGFSAACAAVLVAYSTIMPELEQRMNLFFVIPIRFRAKFYAMMVVALASMCVFSGTLTVIGPAGILAGCILGWAWATQLGFGNPLWIQRMIFDSRQREARRERMNAEDFVSHEVDPILDKISCEGLQSLTRSEWKVLQQGSGKLGGGAEQKNAKEPV